MIFIYSLLFTLLTVLLSPVLAILSITDRWGMRQRLARRPLVRDSEKRPVVWFHCASVGEATGMAALIGGFAARHPGFATLATTVTETGLAYVRKHVPHIHASGLAPLDAPFIVHRVFGRVRPRALILLEGELWPALLKAAAAHDCPVFLVNGRMSDRSIARNRFVKPLFREMLRLLAGVGVQHALDGERYIEFGADPGRVRVTGNVKFDLAAEPDGQRGRPSRQQLRRDLGLSESVPVIMAGCPRPVEEEVAVLAAFTRSRARFPDVRLIWAPRHLHRIPEVERMLAGAGLAYARRTRPTSQARPPDTRNPAHPDVIILDTMGELSAMYGAADMAFVGATLVPLGGHNLLEPAACGIPVLFGPHTENVRASAAALLRTGGGVVVRDGDELARAWLALLEDPEKRARRGASARQAVRTRAKAVDRTLDIMESGIPNRVERPVFYPAEPGGSDRGRPASGLLACFESAPLRTRMLDPDERSPVIRFVRGLLRPLSLLLGILVRCRNGLYDRGLLAAEQLPVPVISVGGLTAGGAGKTPVVRYLAQRLLDAGYRPAVLSRGYGRKTSALRRAAPGANWQEVGDEPAFLSSKLPDVPVVVGPSRAAAGRRAVEHYGANVILLDDGFQHRRIARDLDIVVQDASSRSTPGRLLPAGSYREPLSTLGRGHALVLTRTDQIRAGEPDPACTDNPNPARVQARFTDLDPVRLQTRFPHLALIETVYRPDRLRRLADETILPLQWLTGRDLLVLCGIANPASFAQTVADAGGLVRRILAYPDHHPFTNRNLDRAMSLAEETGAAWLVTTEKDAVRIPAHPVRDRLVVVDVALHLTSGEHTLEKMLSTLDEMR